MAVSPRAWVELGSRTAVCLSSVPPWDVLLLYLHHEELWGTLAFWANKQARLTGAAL